MVKIRTKRIYDAFSTDDGYRVLVDRLWPRGIKKEDAHFDLWEKDLAPSTDLREWFHEDPDNRWNEFVQRYTKQLIESGEISMFIDKIKTKSIVTLLYSSKDAKKNNAIVLGEFLQKKLT